MFCLPIVNIDVINAEIKLFQFSKRFLYATARSTVCGVLDNVFAVKTYQNIYCFFIAAVFACFLLAVLLAILMQFKTAIESSIFCN